MNELDKDAMGRFFPKAKKEDIVRNFKNPDNSGYNSTFTYPRGGAIEYTNSLLSRLDKDKIHLNEELISIDVEKQVAKTNKREIPYSRLISTVPFPQIITKTQGGGELDCSWNKVLVFNLGFDCKGADKANHWIYFPSKEIRFYRIGYYDNIMNTEKMSLYVEIGFGKNEEIDTQHELKKVLGDLLKTGVTNSDQKLISYHSVLMDPAYVHISNDSQAKVEEAKRELALSNIYSIGRYGSWTYCSIEDNIIEAKSLAYEIN